MLGRFLEPLNNPLCHGTLARARATIHQHQRRFADCEIVESIVEPFERALYERMCASVQNELKRAILHSEKLAKATDLEVGIDRRALLHNRRRGGFNDVVPVSRVASGVCHKGRIYMVTNACLRVLALESLDAARCGAADHFKQVGIDGSSLWLELRVRLPGGLILKEQTDTDGNATISAEDALKYVRVVDIRLLN